MLLASLSGCQGLSDMENTATMSQPSAIKGYELYSWQENGVWHFSLVAGTNRLKAFDEISASPSTATSVAELRTYLERLAPGDEIVWITWTDDRLSMPPPAIVAEIEKICRELRLELTVASD
jgi:hypothetical protein